MSLFFRESQKRFKLQFLDVFYRKSQEPLNLPASAFCKFGTLHWRILVALLSASAEVLRKPPCRSNFRSATIKELLNKRLWALQEQKNERKSKKNGKFNRA